MASKDCDSVHTRGRSLLFWPHADDRHILSLYIMGDHAASLRHDLPPHRHAVLSDAGDIGVAASPQPEDG
jgi:hypothetical protein